MGLFKTKEKDVIAYLRGLSEDERAALMGKLEGGDDDSETEGEETEEGIKESDDTAEQVADTETAESATESTETPEEAETPTAEETPTEGKTEPLTEEAPPAPPEQVGVSAEALQALDAKYSAQIANYETRIAALESVINALKEKDETEKEGIGYQKAQGTQTAGRETYADVRKRVLGL